MNLFAPMIRRPIGTSLLAMGLAIAGLCAYFLLGVAASPSIEFPFISVAARLPGASAQTMATTVMAPLERHLGRIPGVSDMFSSAADGVTVIGLVFAFGQSTDRAARAVQAAINAATPDLPPLPVPPSYIKANSSSIPVMLVTVTSPTLATDKLYDLADTLVKPTLKQIPGVAQVQLAGGTPHAIRIAFNPSALASVGLSANDLASTLRAANVHAPKGTLTDGITRMTLLTNDALYRPHDFANLIVASRHGVPVRLSDLASVSNGQQNRYAAAWYNRQRSIVMPITKRPEANAVALSKAIRAELPKLDKMLPRDVKLVPLFDLTPAIESWLHEVELALGMSILMVLLVMLVFLRRLRPTVIAMLTVPLSIAGALVTMWVLGFTLNVFSLMALVLCVGFVVDDAIVVIENIVRHLEEGMPPLQAALRGTREIGFTVISITLSLIAIFGPLVFGHNFFTKLMEEFAVTLVATIVISALVSLTLTPALCGRWLEIGQPPPAGIWQRLTARAAGFDRWMLKVYTRGLDWALRHRRLMRWQPLLLLILTMVLAVAVVRTAGGGLMPREDTNLLKVSITADPTISPAQLGKRTKAIVAMILNDPAVKDASSFLGSNQGVSTGNQATAFVDLKPIGDGAGARHVPVQQVVQRLRTRFSRVPDLDVSVRPMQFIPTGGGNSSQRYGFKLQSLSGAMLQGPTLKLAQIMRTMPAFRDVSTSFDDVGKRQTLEVNRATAARLHVDMRQIDAALTESFSQSMVSTIYADNNQYQVVLTAKNAESLSPYDLLNIHVRSTSGKMIPLAALATLKPTIAPLSIEHFNQIEASSISYNLSPGVTQATAQQLLQQAIYQAQFPPGIQRQYTGANKNLMDALSNALIVLLVVLVSMYVVLGILYESLIHPLTILSTLPAAGMGAFLAMLVTQTALTLMSVIAVLMLIGIVKKNAILMVDFALVREREHGLGSVAAIRDAALTRFRPITMTTLVAMGAAMPLALSFGQGSEMRQPLGIAILGGLLVSQLLTLLSTPAIYLWQHDRRERRHKRRVRRAERAQQRRLRRQVI